MIPIGPSFDYKEHRYAVIYIIDKKEGLIRVAISDRNSCAGGQYVFKVVDGQIGRTLDFIMDIDQQKTDQLNFFLRKHIAPKEYAD